MRSRVPAAFVLGVFLATALAGGLSVGQDPKDPKDMKDMKDPPRGPTKLSDLKWPREIAGKDMSAWLKDMNDPDPAIREAALRTLPSFGPDTQKAAGKLLVARLKAEKDPGVKITLFGTIGNIGFDAKDTIDEKEALRLLGEAADSAGPGSATRLHAIQAIGAFGTRGYGQVSSLTGLALQDTSYETRRNIANTLGRIGFSETVGPSQRALVALAGTLAKDVSVSVRMESLQSLVLLGPPWAEVVKPGVKNPPPPKINQEGADIIANHMRHRLGITVKGTTGPKESPEPDKQLEIWCRVVMMRFDTKEITPQNLVVIAKYIDPKADLGPKLQSLQAIALFGEKADKQLDAVVGVLDDDDSLVLTTALTALASMGVKAAGAIPQLEKMEKKWAKLRDEKLQENLKKDKQFSDFYLKLEPKEKEKFIETLQEEQARLGVVGTIKWIKDSKPGKPGGDPPAEPAGSDKKP